MKKLSPPRIEAVTRERLGSKLDRLWQARLGLVIGPAGSGKTTLLTQFAGRAEVPLIWYRADVRDGSEAALLNCLWRGAGHAFDGMRRGWSTVDDMALAFDDWTGGTRALLVVDDLHYLEGSAAEAALGRLVEDGPASLAILMASRRVPSFDLSRLRVSGALLEIGPDDLRFRSWEVEELFRDFYREPLSPEDLAALARRTGGWAAGLQLFHLATRGKPARERQRVVRSLTAGSRLTREYLTRNFLDELPPELTDFLLSTCVLGRMTGALCDELLGSSGSAAKLAELERRHVFTSAIDDGDACVYLYHDVLQAHLEAVLVEREGEAGCRARYRKAAPLLLAYGMLPEALRAYGRTEDWDKAKALLRHRGEEMIEGAAGWIDGLPGRLVDHDPWLQLGMARRALAGGHWAAALDWYRTAERGFEGAGGAGICGRERLALGAWLEPFATPPADWTGVVREATKRDPGTVRHRALGNPRHSSELAAGLCELLAGNVKDAAPLLARVVEAAEAGPLAALGAQIAWTFAAARAGTPADAEQCERLAVLAEALGSPWLAQLARSLVALTGGPDGLDQARRFRSGSEGHGDQWGAALAGLIEGIGLLRAGGDAVAPLEQAAAGFRRLGAGVPEAWCRGAAAVGRARAGDPEARHAALQAEALARAAGVRGAQVLAFTALGTMEGPVASEYRHLAAVIAQECGLALLGFDRPSATPGEAGPAPVEVRCLGQFAIRVQGRPVDGSLVKPRARAALRLLAVHAPKPVRRGMFLNALWPDASEAVGTRNLHVVISALRRLLEPGIARGAPSLIVREGESYRLDLPPGSLSDLVRFDAAMAKGQEARRRGDNVAASAAFRDTLEAYQGDLLADEGTSEWIGPARDRYRADAATAAQSLAEMELADGNAAAAAITAGRGLIIERYRDQLWRLRVTASARAGHVADAARMAQEYRAVLADLGIEVDVDDTIPFPDASFRPG